MPPAIPILMYHLVAPQPPAAFRKYAVSTRMFAAQLRCLSLLGYEPISLDTLLQARSGQARLPTRPVVITFDDGFQACVEHALPLLRAQRFPATFFLVAGAMGKTSRWLQAELGLEFPIMDWPTARQLVTEGVECGAHSLSHPRLPQLSAHACRGELETARCMIEDKLGRPIQHLAYPYGSYNAQVQTLVAETGYRSACSVRMGVSTLADEVLALHRVPIDGHDSLLDFVCRLRTAWTVREIAHQKVYGTWCRLRDHYPSAPQTHS